MKKRKMHNLIKRLEKKGWEKEEISKAVGIIEGVKRNKSRNLIFLEKHIYWILLVVIVTANFAISIALMPLLIALSGAFLYFTIFFIGIVFGLLFELVIRSVEHLEKRHHLILSVFIPLTALVNIFVISGISNNLAIELSLTNIHIPIVVGLVYAASFVLPYIIYRFVLKIEYYAKE